MMIAKRNGHGCLLEIQRHFNCQTPILGTSLCNPVYRTPVPSWPAPPHPALPPAQSFSPFCCTPPGNTGSLLPPPPPMGPKGPPTEPPLTAKAPQPLRSRTLQMLCATEFRWTGGPRGRCGARTGRTPQTTTPPRAPRRISDARPSASPCPSVRGNGSRRLSQRDANAFFYIYHFQKIECSAVWMS